MGAASVQSRFYNVVIHKYMLHAEMLKCEERGTFGMLICLNNYCYMYILPHCVGVIR